MSKTTFEIRAVTKADIPGVLTLIKQLAEYEKLAHEVVATDADIEAAMFGPNANAETIVCEQAGKLVGMALFFHNYSTFTGRRGLYLEDLFVLKEQRGSGIGLALLKKLASIAVERGCARFEWSVLDWNEPAIKFYDSLGAKPMADWTVYRLDGEPLKKLAAPS